MSTFDQQNQTTHNQIYQSKYIEIDDKISAGDISNSEGVTIGKNITIYVMVSNRLNNLTSPFRHFYEAKNQRRTRVDAGLRRSDLIASLFMFNLYLTITNLAYIGLILYRFH